MYQSNDNNIDMSASLPLALGESTGTIREKGGEGELVGEARQCKAMRL